MDGPYQWLKKISETGTGISYETSQPYMACSSESKEGFCPNAVWTCTSLNVARTCGSFDSEGGSCSGLNAYPNATISDYGSISGVSAMQKEIYQRGPIACGIDAMPLLNWESGIISDAGSSVDHVISVVGWGNDASQGQYWILLRSFRHCIRANCRPEMANIQQAQQMIPLITREISLVKMSASWFLVSMYLIWILESRLIRSNNQSRATL